MTPMVDLAFLLVTFFMLTTQFRPEEPVTVDIPTSTDSIPLPTQHVAQLTIAKDGRVFFDMTAKPVREKLLRRMSSDYRVGFTEEEISRFGNLATFGMPVSQLRTWLNLPPSERATYQHPGIPYDSANNELKSWVLNARLVDPKVNVAIKGDRDAQYKVFKDVVRIVQGEPKVNRFYLLTNAEARPSGK